VKQLWNRYAERIDALSVRERVLVFSTAMALLLALVYTLFIDPQLGAQKRLSAAVMQRQAELKGIEAQITAIATSRAANPDRSLRERLAEVRKQLGETEAQIAAEERRFTAPEQMKTVIEEMLARNRAVQLVSMKTLASSTLAEARAEAGKAEAPKPAAKPAAEPGRPQQGERLVYRHGVEVTVAGGYLDLLRYLRDLEHLRTQLYWSSLEIDATRYPRHTMKIVVYTLSLDPAWLNV
jgi:MSHA biogenesis protein MshJ